LTSSSTEDKNPLLGRAYYYLGKSIFQRSLHLIEFEKVKNTLESALGCFMKAQSNLVDTNTNLFYYSRIMVANCFLRLNDIPKYLELMKYMLQQVNQCDSIETKLIFFVSYSSGLYNISDYGSSSGMLSQANQIYQGLSTTNSPQNNPKKSIKLSQFSFILNYNNEIISYYLGNQFQRNYLQNLNPQDKSSLQKISELRFKLLLKSPSDFPTIDNEYAKLMNNANIEKENINFQFLQVCYYLKRKDWKSASQILNNININSLIYNEDIFFYNTLLAIVAFYENDFAASLNYFIISQKIFNQLEYPNVQLMSDLLFNIGVCNYFMGQLKESFDSFYTMISSYEASIPPGMVNYIKSIINTLKVRMSPTKNYKFS